LFKFGLLGRPEVRFWIKIRMKMKRKIKLA